MTAASTGVPPRRPTRDMMSLGSAHLASCSLWPPFWPRTLIICYGLLAVGIHEASGSCLAWAQGAAKGRLMTAAAWCAGPAQNELHADRAKVDLQAAVDAGMRYAHLMSRLTCDLALAWVAPPAERRLDGSDPAGEAKASGGDVSLAQRLNF